MKRTINGVIAAALAVVLLLAAGVGCESDDPVVDVDPAAPAMYIHEPPADEPEEFREFRAVWVATVINLDFPSQPGLSAADLMSEIDYIVERAHEIGLNAILLQVRPLSDALYRSDIYPWSHYLTGEQGKAPDSGFDPLAYWIESAHALDIELHAWINPYRVTHSTEGITDINRLAPDNPARLNPDWVTEYGGALYFDPGIPEVRELVIRGVEEIITQYDVDGVHMDDYFYPARAFDDAATYDRFGGGADKDEWRRENINELVRSLREMIEDTRPDIKFGISPSGIWQNASDSPLGSDTRGFSHYTELSADSVHWVNEGWLDYICPQIYWYIGFDIADYETLLRWWEDVCRGTGVDLYIGHAAYRESPPENDRWNGEMLRQLEMNEQSDVVRGSIFFRASHLYGDLGGRIRDFYAERPEARPVPPVAEREPRPSPVMDALTVAIPSGNVTVASDARGYNMMGGSIPGLPLYVNGDPVENRTEEGFFSVYARLETGENTFTFSQPGQPDVTRVITSGGTASPAPATPAPSLRQYGRDELYYATVTSELAWLYPNPRTSGGSEWHAVRGQTDRITAVTDDGNWARLSNGYWIANSDISRARTDVLTENTLQGSAFGRDAHTEWISWESDVNPVARVDYSRSGRTLTVFFGMQTEPPPIPNTVPPEDSIFESCTSGTDANGTPYVTLTLKAGAVIDGYETLYADGAVRLHVRPRRSLSDDAGRPFTGFTFVIDPGHGGSQPGAIGPMGASFAEKHLTLIYANKLAERLERLGATIVHTRTSDVTVELHERVVISYNARPDMFISMHTNSVAETTDATNIRGITFWYRNEASAPLADLLMNELYDINPRTTRYNNSNQGNLYVCRGAWAPSVIVEASFMCNIDDFSWMVNERNQNELADALVDALLLYYGG